jgi:hypothetical protein
MEKNKGKLQALCFYFSHSTVVCFPGSTIQSSVTVVTDEDHAKIVKILEYPDAFINIVKPLSELLLVSLISFNNIWIRLKQF